MRVDSLGPRTWLFAGLAGWAVCLWVFALFGLGGRLGAAEGEVEPQPLPTAKIPAAERPGPLAQYDEIATRPVFAENRKPQAFVIGGNGEEPQANTFDYALTSVLMAGDVKLAILKPAAEGAKPVRVKLGEAVETAPQWSLATLESRRAIFRGPEGEKILELRVFNGIGGAMPAVANAGAPMPAAGPAPGNVINESPPEQPANQGPGPQQAQVAPPTPPPPQVNTAAPTAPVSTEAQLEAIRRRIEARRAQIRQQAAQEAQNAGGSPPGQTP
jgi:general secretion pathway protein N